MRDCAINCSVCCVSTHSQRVTRRTPSVSRGRHPVPSHCGQSTCAIFHLHVMRPAIPAGTESTIAASGSTWILNQTGILPQPILYSNRPYPFLNPKGELPRYRLGGKQLLQPLQGQFVKA